MKPFAALILAGCVAVFIAGTVWFLLIIIGLIGPLFAFIFS